jgi:tRNA dimethylallyltransferase
VRGEVVNCDSLQIYRRFDIGTAKLPLAERRGVPHHLIDIVDAADVCTAGAYAQAARAILSQIAQRGHVPIVVGGTGFYLRALLDGLFPGPTRDQPLRDRLDRRETGRPGSLHRLLSRLDPQAAARIHSNDRPKLIRALEVRLLRGKPISEMFQEGRDPLTGFRPVKIGLSPPRDLLYERLNARAVRIFQSGLIEEVRAILASGVPADAKPFESLGYSQALDVLQGRLTEQEAIASTQQQTRRYAKRQTTWFRKEHGVHWIEGFGDDPVIQQQILSIIR